MNNIVEVDSLCRTYGPRKALDGVSFSVVPGECFGLLGPNGGGKTTLFKILTTLLPPTSGHARIMGSDVLTNRESARRHLGVVFQSPSLDIYLSCRENLRHGGHLYGHSGGDLESRIKRRLDNLGIADRADDLVRTLSGGMRRRVEIAKALLHEPAVLILDEPSTGLDPVARRQLWQQLEAIRQEAGVTVLLTTHFLDEADRCDRIAILDQGRLIACGTPSDLKSRIGGDCITITCENADSMAERISRRIGSQVRVVDGGVRIEASNGMSLIGPIMTEFGSEIGSVTLGKPTLEDVFLRETGHRFESSTEARPEAA